MTKYVINGGKPLYGSVNIAGMKNAAVAIIPATVLVEGVCRIENVPKISDVTIWLNILESIGAKIRLINDSTIEIDTTVLRTVEPPYELMERSARPITLSERCSQKWVGRA